MTDLEICKIIHEARGLCWHEWEQVFNCGGSKCRHCGNYFTLPPDKETKAILQNANYTSDWRAYGEFLEWAQKEEWWEEFACDIDWDKEGYEIHSLKGELLNPLRGSTAFAEWWKEKEK